MRNLILSLVFLTSCAAQQVYPRLPTADRGADIAAVLKYVFQHKNLSIGPWRNWHTVLIDSPLIFHSETVDTRETKIIVLDGLTSWREQEILVYDYQPCLAASSLIHEIFHALGYSHEMHPDIWENEVKDLTEQATRDLCGEDYVPWTMPEPTMEQIRGASPFSENIDF